MSLAIRCLAFTFTALVHVVCVTADRPVVFQYPLGQNNGTYGDYMPYVELWTRLLRDTERHQQVRDEWEARSSSWQFGPSSDSEAEEDGELSEIFGSERYEWVYPEGSMNRLPEKRSSGWKAKQIPLRTVFILDASQKGAFMVDTVEGKLLESLKKLLNVGYAKRENYRYVVGSWDIRARKHENAEEAKDGNSHDQVYDLIQSRIDGYPGDSYATYGDAGSALNDKVIRADS